MNLIVNVFPLHDKDELKKLEFVWYKSVSSYLPFNLIPISKPRLNFLLLDVLRNNQWTFSDRIRNYFGESVAFYFQFFEYYTKALYSFALFGLLVWILPLSSFHKFIICSLFNLVWNTLFSEIWKRKSAESCFEWGIFDLDLNDSVRPQFKGELRISPITGKHELYYSKFIRHFSISLDTFRFLICVNLNLKEKKNIQEIFHFLSVDRFGHLDCHIAYGCLLSSARDDKLEI